MTVYNHSSLVTDVVITDSEPKLKHPPTPDEGEVLNVNFEYRNVIGEGTFVRCQSCSRPIHYTEPHVFASVKWYGTHWPSFKHLHFCDASCWGEWASQDPDATLKAREAE